MRTRSIVAMIMLVDAILIAMCVKPGHNWGGDFALYISQSQALLDGHVSDLYTSNRYQVEHSYWNIGPYLYPFGFPILLMPVLATAGLNFVVLKLYCMAFFIASVPLLEIFLRDFVKPVFWRMLAVLVISLHAQFIIYTDNVLSDVPFYFFVLLSWVLIRRSSTPWMLLLTGLSITMTYLIRDAGIFLLLVFMFNAFLQRRTEKAVRFLWLVIPVFTFTVVIVAVFFALPKGGENFYSMMMSSMTGKVLLEGLAHYYFLVPSVLWNANGSWAVAVSWIVSLCGMAWLFKNYVLSFAFILPYTVILLLWPGYGGARYIFPLMPFFIGSIAGLAASIVQRWPRSNWWTAVPAAGLCAWFVFSQLVLIYKFSKADTNESFTPAMLRMYSEVKKMVPEKEVIGFFKPHVLRLNTGRNAICVDAQRFTASSVNYFLTECADTALIDPKPEVILVSGDFCLLRKQSADNAESLVNPFQDQ